VVLADSGGAPREDNIGISAQSRKVGSSRRSRLSLRWWRLTASSSAGVAMDQVGKRQREAASSMSGQRPRSAMGL
jgi:hypothetical protein